MKVVATGTFSFSAKSINASEARSRMTPLPAMITGAFAFEIMSATWAHLPAGAVGIAGYCTFRGAASAAASAPAMFSGKSMKQAPGFSVCAVLNALRTISGMTSGVRIWVEYLVIGSKRFTRSRIW